MSEICTAKKEDLSFESSLDKLAKSSLKEEPIRASKSVKLKNRFFKALIPLIALVFMQEAQADSKAEIGRSLSSVEVKSNVTLQELRRIQIQYNKTNNPKARLVEGKFRMMSAENDIEIVVLDLQNQQFEVNDQKIKFSYSSTQEQEIARIKQILNKGQVLGTSDPDAKDNALVAKAVYDLLLIASTYSM